MIRSPIVTRWDDLPVHAGRPGLLQRGLGTDDALLLLNEFDPAVITPAPHVHPDFDQLIVVIAGTADLRLDGVAHRVTLGDVALVPAGVQHATEPIGPDTFRSLEVFAPMREDYRHLLRWMD